MNDVMSFGIHRFWKDYFIKTLGPVSGMKLLDVAGGTGRLGCYNIRIFMFISAEIYFIQAIIFIIIKNHML